MDEKRPISSTRFHWHLGGGNYNKWQPPLIRLREQLTVVMKFAKSTLPHPPDRINLIFVLVRGTQVP